jgi:hypothetical protein
MGKRYLQHGLMIRTPDRNTFTRITTTDNAGRKLLSFFLVRAVVQLPGTRPPNSLIGKRNKSQAGSRLAFFGGGGPESKDKISTCKQQPNPEPVRVCHHHHHFHITVYIYIMFHALGPVELSE